MNYNPENEVKTFRRGLRWAIMSTSVFGLPLLMPVVGVITHITLGNLLSDVLLDPTFFIFLFASISLTSGLLVVLHYELVSRVYTPPLIKYLQERHNTEGDKKRKVALEAIHACQRFPYQTWSWSVVFYLLGVSPLILMLNFVMYTLTLGQSIMAFLATVIAGVLLSFFQLFTSRKHLHSVKDIILEDFPEFTQDTSINKMTYGGLKTQILVAVIILSSSLVALTGMSIYSEADRDFNVQMGRVYKQLVLGQESEILNLLKANQPVKQAEQTFERIRLHGDEMVFILDSEDQSLLVPPSEAIWEHVISTILDTAPRESYKNRPIVLKLSDDGIFGVVIKHNMYVISMQENGDGKNTVITVNPVGKTKERKASRTMMLIVLTAIFMAALLSFFYARFFSDEINRPISAIIHSIQQVSEGNLEEQVRVASQDEIGILALNQARMVEKLKEMMSRIAEASAKLDQSARQIADKNEQVHQGTEVQSQSVETTTVSMEQMDRSIKEIATNIETLATSAEESSASIIEVGMTIEEVGGNVENLSTSVEQTTSSIQQMTASIKEVADNVQQLTQRSGSATSAFHEIENSISAVGKSSEQTAHFTEQVTSDAEQSAKTVDKTIEGIGKIKQTAEQVQEVITSLSHRVGSIDTILSVIRDVTEETNLLALNAAIIAAQAGDHGRGFAVVADEIKDLAERTVASTSEIADVIMTVQDEAKLAMQSVIASSENVEQGVMLSRESGVAIQKILKNARESQDRTREIAKATAFQTERAKQVMSFFEGVNVSINQIANATQEQTRGGDHIYQAAQEMEIIAQQVKRATREQAKGSRQITQAIENISQIVSFINSTQGEQLKNASSVLQSMQQIREVVENNTEHVTDMTQAVDNLRFLADELREMIEMFKVQSAQDSHPSTLLDTEVTHKLFNLD